MKQWKKLLPLTLIALSLSACADNTHYKTYTVNCTAKTLVDIPEEFQPRCDEFTIQQAVNFWNDAAAKDGIQAIFAYDPESKMADIHIVADITAPAKDCLWLPIANSENIYFIAHNLGRQIKVPLNPNPESIMNEAYQSAEPNTLKVTSEDLDAYVNSF